MIYVEFLYDLLEVSFIFLNQTTRYNLKSGIRLDYNFLFHFKRPNSLFLRINIKLVTTVCIIVIENRHVT